MGLHLKMASVSGTSSDRHHPGWLDVVTAEWAVSRAITSDTATRRDRESANAVITDLEILRRMDCASPALFIAACCGRGETMILELTKTGAGQGSDTDLH